MSILVIIALFILENEAMSRKQPSSSASAGSPNPKKEVEFDAHFHSSLLDSIQEAVVSVDVSFSILYLNHAAEKMFGWSLEEIRGRTVNELLKYNLDKSQRESILKELTEGRRVEMELPLQHKEGFTFWAEAAGLMLRASNKSVQGYVFTLRDCSERRRLEEDLDRTHLQLTQRVNELETFFDAVSDAIFLYYPDGRIKVNRGARLILGFDPSGLGRIEALSRLKFFSSEGQALPLDELPNSRALGGERVVNQRLVIQNSFGEERVVLASASPIYRAGELLGAAVIWQEITERERVLEESRCQVEQERDKLQSALAALQESEEAFRMLADSMPQLVWTAQPDGRVDYYNQRYLEFAGIAPKAGEEWTWMPTLHHEDVDITVAAWQKALETGQVYQVEHRARMADGSFRWQLSRGIPARDSRGSIIRWYGTATDIHDAKQAEQALRDALAQAEEGRLLLEAILEHIPDGLAITGGPPDFPILKVSRYGKELSGRSGMGLIGLPAGQHVGALGLRLSDGETPPAPEQTPVYRAAWFGEETHNREFWIVNAEGRKIPVLVNAAPIRNRQGEVVGAIKSWRDITDRKMVEQALRKSESRFRRLVESGILGILYRDAAGKVYEANQAFLKTVGRKMEELHAGELHWKTLTPPEYWETDLQNLQQARRQGACKPYEKEYLRPDGSRVPVLVGYALLEDSEENYIGFILDLTELKQAQAALEEYAARLERSNQELEAFAFVASHDLQEPLRKIRSFSDHLSRMAGPKLDEIERDYLARMSNGAERMQRMITDLLSLSRVTTHAQPFQSLELYQPVAEAIFNLENALARSQGQVKVGELPVIEADPAQMSQLFQNLIGNALKYHRKDVPPQVTVAAELLPNGSQPAQVRITVEDNGTGFPNDQAERIFQPFQRLHRGKNYEGTGIGLAICRKIVERHSGEIRADSNPGQGSRFIITLPVRQ